MTLSINQSGHLNPATKTNIEMKDDRDRSSNGMSPAAAGNIVLLGIFSLVLAAALLYVAVALWPPDFLDTSFGQMTLIMLFRFAGAIGLFVIGIVVLIFSLGTFGSSAAESGDTPKFSNQSQPVVFSIAVYAPEEQARLNRRSRVTVKVAIAVAVILWVCMVGSLYYLR